MQFHDGQNRTGLVFESDPVGCPDVVDLFSSGPQGNREGPDRIVFQSHPFENTEKIRLPHESAKGAVHSRRQHFEIVDFFPVEPDPWHFLGVFARGSHVIRGEPKVYQGSSVRRDQHL